MRSLQYRATMSNDQSESILEEPAMPTCKTFGTRSERVAYTERPAARLGFEQTYSSAAAQYAVDESARRLSLGASPNNPSEEDTRRRTALLRNANDLLLLPTMDDLLGNTRHRRRSFTLNDHKSELLPIPTINWAQCGGQENLLDAVPLVLKKQLEAMEIRLVELIIRTVVNAVSHGVAPAVASAARPQPRPPRQLRFKHDDGTESTIEEITQSA
jgi:hypothetical protein